MKKKYVLFVVALIALVSGGAFLYLKNERPPIESKFIPQRNEPVSPKGDVIVKKPASYALVPNPNHTYQTFNNCGPATLSMALSLHGVNISQKELGDLMRPYQNQAGDNDDKTIFTYEFVDWAKKYDLEAVGRVNGDIELLKTFTSNGIAVVVKTWLNVNDDIGHFRIVRGFDEEKQVIIQDDSYHGPNKRIPYYDFLSMWQPFNYDYMIVYTKDQEALVNAILGDEVDELKSWENALVRAQNESNLDSENIYPVFNESTAYYHIGNFQGSVDSFEKVESKLPKRMLWYQIEPILAYKELGNYNRVFAIIQNILENGNRAYSELYMIRGEIYLSQGNIDAARVEFNSALQYNKNFTAAQEALNNL